MKRRFTAKQARALSLIASGMTGAATAKSVGVKESTVSYWRNHTPDFAEELQKLQDQSTVEAMTQLRALVTLATAEVQRIIAEGQNDAIKLKAAEYVINNFGLSKQPYVGPTDSNEFSGKVDLGLILQGLVT
jgi:transposase-like protein